MNANNQQTDARPPKICIVFDEEESSRSAEIVIKRVASGFEHETQKIQFDELDPPAQSVSAARSACGADILVLAVCDDRMLPGHVQSWLELCLSLRDEGQERALVLLVQTATEGGEPNSLLLDYLGDIAAECELVFFVQVQTTRRQAREEQMVAGGWN